MTNKALGKPCKLDPDLAAKLEACRGYEMSKEEKAIQRKSWIKGEMMLAHPDMTEEQFEKIWRSL